MMMSRRACEGHEEKKERKERAQIEDNATDTEINKPVLMNMLWHILMIHTRLFEHLSFHLACYLQVK